MNSPKEDVEKEFVAFMLKKYKLDAAKKLRESRDLDDTEESEEIEGTVRDTEESDYLEDLDESEKLGDSVSTYTEKTDELNEIEDEENTITDESSLSDASSEEAAYRPYYDPTGRLKARPIYKLDPSGKFTSRTKPKVFGLTTEQLCANAEKGNESTANSSTTTTTNDDKQDSEDALSSSSIVPYIESPYCAVCYCRQTLTVIYPLIWTTSCPNCKSIMTEINRRFPPDDHS